MTQDELQAIQTMMEQVMDSKLQPVHEQLQSLDSRVSTLQADMTILKTDVAIIKEEAAITRHTGNLLLKWAERADRTVVNVGLYDSDEEPSAH